MLRVGESIEQYVLTAPLPRDQEIAYVQTWRAVDSSGTEVVLKIFFVNISDDYGGREDLSGMVTRAVPELDRLRAAWLPRSIAPFLRYHWSTDERRLVLCRRYCRDRLVDRFPAGRADDRPHPGMLNAFAEIAEGVDALERQWAGGNAQAHALRIRVNNLLMEGEQAFLADFAPFLEPLKDRIASEYGPRLVRAPNPCLYLGCGEAQSNLAALYHYLRTGKSVFGDLPLAQPRMRSILQLQESERECLKTGKLPIDGTLNPGETGAIARAMAKTPAERFPTCTALVRELAQACEKGF